MQAQEPDKNWCTVWCKFLGFYWRGVFLIVWPCLAGIVFLLGFEKKFRCLFVLVLMAGYWVTECIPLYVTGLIPTVLFPLLDVQSTADVSVNYMNKTNLIFLGSIFIALGIEYSGLHYRIAYCTILCLGCSLRKLHFGFALVTTLLSMFLINTACTAMMCPILEAILLELEAQGVGAMYKPKLPTEDRARPTNITTAYFLTAAYASTIGGIGTLVGTGTNLTYKGLFETRFPEGTNIDFVPWLLFNVPPMLVLAFICYITLEIIFMGLGRPSSDDYQTVKKANEYSDIVRNVIKTKMAEMGKFSFQEICILILFTLCVLAWFFRKPQFMPGWGELYSVTVAAATPAIAVILLFAIIPSSLSFFDYCTKDPAARPTKASKALVPWAYLSQKFPWGLMFLLGGGFAIADAGKHSGMSKFLGEQLSVMKSLPGLGVLAITSLFAEFATELTANVAVCNIVIPILMEMSVGMKLHPIKLSLPAAVMCSFAFLLPVGTPPNAIASDYANIQTTDMIKGGIILKLCAWMLYVALVPTYGALIFEQTSFPEWADDSTNTTEATL